MTPSPKPQEKYQGCGCGLWVCEECRPEYHATPPVDRPTYKELMGWWERPTSGKYVSIANRYKLLKRDASLMLEALVGLMRHVEVPDPETSTEDIDRANALLQRLGK